jgi:hypothetical protein
MEPFCCPKDSTDYLHKMAALNPFPSNTTMVTIDVTSLYTNIPHSDGIGACKEMWESRSVNVPPTDCLVTMLVIEGGDINSDHSSVGWERIQSCHFV